MHAFLTTIPFTANTEARERFIAEYNRAHDNVDGLLMKIWFWDDISISVAHFFRGAHELNAYLTSGLLSTLSNLNGCNGSVTSRIYEVPFADLAFEAASATSAAHPIGSHHEQQKLEAL